MDSSLIYGTVPVESLCDAEDLRQVRELLESSPGSWRTAREIARLAGLPEQGTQVMVRRAITELIEVSHCPIVSGHAGFTWAPEESRESMMRHYRESLLRRARGLDRRIMAVEEIQQEGRGQQSLKEYGGVMT